MYIFDETKILISYQAKISANNKFFEKYNKRIWSAFNLYKDNPNLVLPKGTDRFNQNDNGKISLIGLTIRPESSLYPSQSSEKEIFKLIGQAGLDISLCRSDSLTHSSCSSENADLTFSTQTIKPILTYLFKDSMIEIEANDLKPDKEEFTRRNKGGIESLIDLKDGQVSLSLSDLISNELNENAFELAKPYLIFDFSLNILNRRFSSLQLCKNTMPKYTQYYLALPKDMTKTNLDIKCRE